MAMALALAMEPGLCFKGRGRETPESVTEEGLRHSARPASCPPARCPLPAHQTANRALQERALTASGANQSKHKDFMYFEHVDYSADLCCWFCG
jgi:hypothetical protein